MVKIIYKIILTLCILFFSHTLYAKDRKTKDNRRDYYGYSYNDKYYGMYGFDPVPPHFKIAPGFRKNHGWYIGGNWHGQGGYSPGYKGILWFGYCIEW